MYTTASTTVFKTQRILRVCLTLNRRPPSTLPLIPFPLGITSRRIISPSQLVKRLDIIPMSIQLSFHQLVKRLPAGAQVAFSFVLCRWAAVGLVRW